LGRVPFVENVGDGSPSHYIHVLHIFTVAYLLYLTHLPDTLHCLPWLCAPVPLTINGLWQGNDS